MLDSMPFFQILFIHHLIHHRYLPHLIICGNDDRQIDVPLRPHSKKYRTLKQHSICPLQHFDTLMTEVYLKARPHPNISRPSTANNNLAMENLPNLLVKLMVAREHLHAMSHNHCPLSSKRARYQSEEFTLAWANALSPTATSTSQELETFDSMMRYLKVISGDE